MVARQVNIHKHLPEGTTVRRSAEFSGGDPKVTMHVRRAIN